MLQKISDFIKSELQSMLKNRQQSQKISGGFAPWTTTDAGAPRLDPSTPLQSPNVNSNNFLATSRKNLEGKPA